MNGNRTANIIKIFAVITAAPRWVGALLAAEGFPIPSEWKVWWIPVSAIMSAGMAIVEGMSFAYVFEAWRNQKDKSGDRLFWFAVGSAMVFVVVLAPYIAAQVKGVTIYQMLYNDLFLYIWATAVGASTIFIVGSVGYAQKRNNVPEAKTSIAKPTKDTAINTSGKTTDQAGKQLDQPVVQIEELALIPETTQNMLPELEGTRKAIFEALVANSGASNKAIGDLVGKSDELVRKYKKELKQKGYLP